MSSFSSIYSSLSGLFGFAKALDNASDNIANINTPGFKGRDLHFRELTNEGGDGVGVDVSNPSLRSQQGDINETGNATDIAIDGNGFFILRDGDSEVYTRSGQFQFDEEGFLIDPVSKRRVAALEINGQLADLLIDRKQVSEAIATTIVSLAGNLDSESEPGATFPGEQGAPIEIEIIDRLGQIHTLSMEFTKDGANSWEVQLFNSENIALGRRFGIVFGEDGTPTESGSKIEFSFQPFSILALKDYEDAWQESMNVTVSEGELVSTSDLLLDLGNEYSLLLRSGADEGIETTHSTRFRFDAEGNFIDADSGLVVQAINSNEELENLNLGALFEDKGEATSKITFIGNLDANVDAVESGANVLIAEVVDTGGRLRELEISLTKGKNNTWGVDVTDIAGNIISSNNVIVFSAEGNSTASSFALDYDPFSTYTQTPIAEILNESESVNLSNPGDLTSSENLVLSLNESAVEKNAFFILRNDEGFEFSQSLDLIVDEDGSLTHDHRDGHRLMTVDDSGFATEIDLSEFTEVDGTATSLVELRATFDPADDLGTNFPTDSPTGFLELSVFDSTGKTFNWKLNINKTDVNQWALELVDESGEPIVAAYTLDFSPATGELVSGGELLIDYQPVENLSDIEIEQVLQIPPPINVSSGDLSTAAPGDLLLTTDSSQTEGDGESQTYFALGIEDSITYVDSVTAVFDSDNVLIDENTGSVLSGIDSEGLLMPIDGTDFLISDPKATTQLKLIGTLDRSDPNPQVFIASVFDSNGDLHDLTLTLTRVGTDTNNQWDVQIVDDNGADIFSTDIDADLFFSSSGNGLHFFGSIQTSDFDPLGDGTIQNIQIDFSGVSAPVSVPQPLSLVASENNGRNTGQIDQIQFDPQGQLVFSYDNGDEQTVAKLAIRKFTGPSLSLELALKFQEDPDFGTDVRINSINGQEAGLLESFIVDGSGVIQMTYSNGETVSGPRIGIVERTNDSIEGITLDFSSVTSIANMNSDIAINSTDGIVNGEIESFRFDEEGILQLTYSNGNTAEGQRIALAQISAGAVKDVTIDFGPAGTRDGVTSSAAGNSNITVEDSDGREAGNMVSVVFNEEGVLIADFSNGENRELQRIALANFSDLSSLIPASGSFFRTTNINNRTLGRAGEAMFGSISPNSLELSNVDLTSEFGSIIIIQRGFQAASQALNATNEVIEELYNSVKGR